LEFDFDVLQTPFFNHQFATTNLAHELKVDTDNMDLYLVFVLFFPGRNFTLGAQYYSLYQYRVVIFLLESPSRKA
jgi:hypothetical protein